jgi:hypothetical protein
VPFWNVTVGLGETSLLNMSATGGGGFKFYNSSSTLAPVLGVTFSGAGAITAVGNVTANGVSMATLNTSVNALNTLTAGLLIDGYGNMSYNGGLMQGWGYTGTWVSSTVGTARTIVHNQNCALVSPIARFTVLWSASSNPTLGTNAVHDMTGNGLNSAGTYGYAIRLVDTNTISIYFGTTAFFTGYNGSAVISPSTGYVCVHVT